MQSGMSTHRSVTPAAPDPDRAAQRPHVGGHFHHAAATSAGSPTAAATPHTHCTPSAHAPSGAPINHNPTKRPSPSPEADGIRRRRRPRTAGKGGGSALTADRTDGGSGSGGGAAFIFFSLYGKKWTGRKPNAFNFLAQ